MSTTEDRIRSVMNAYMETVDTPPVETVIARAERETGRPNLRRRRRIRRGTIAGLLGVAIVVPSAAAMVINHSVDPFAGLNPDSKTSPLTKQLPRIPAGAEPVPHYGYLTLTVEPGTVDDRSCFNLTLHLQQSTDTQGVTACGGGEGATYAENLLGAAVVYSDDPAVTRVRVTAGNVTYDRPLHARYCLMPQLPDKPITITTYDTNGKVIAIHHTRLPQQAPPLKDNPS